MIRPLTGLAAGELPQADAIVIGAGIAGLIAADRLARSDYRVLVLESGGETQESDTHPLNEVVMRGRTYGGAADGRFRCLGGTSTRWGGAMIPFLAADLERAGWPVGMDELAPFVPQVEALFGLPPGPYDCPGVLESDTHLARLGKWPAFGKRNVASLLRQRIAGAGPIEVLLGAHVCGFEGAEGRLSGVEVAADDGSRQVLRAPQVFICAGAIESTRLLLLLDRALPTRLPQPDAVTGRHFHDHVSCRTGTFTVSDRRAFNRLAGFRFEGEGMRNLRFELAPGSALRETQPPQFTHIGFEAEEGGDFAALRDAFRAVQRRSLPSPALLGRLARGAPWLARAAWWRFAEKRVLAPAKGEAAMVSVVEQAPRAENRITLSAERTDRFGVPLAEIAWDLAEEDVANTLASAHAFAAAWDRSALTRLASLALRDDAAIRAELGNSGGIYHPCGSTRMGRDAREGSVDDQCRVFGLDNLRVFSTSVMPTSGGANPTMMMILLALRSLALMPAR